ncbi:unnamed protein product [Schistocephalus solidus]|uniref:WKF domain-containing protein n=1 Tax=Schistocephalus solidus TaxID=70667 RepID=A0A183SXE6_SCHSO|nr:unnamed protein product [Schistocephalus solidus]
MVSLKSDKAETPAALRSTRSVKFSTTLTCTETTPTAAAAGKLTRQPKSCLKRPAEVSVADAVADSTLTTTSSSSSSTTKKAKKSLNARKHLKWLKRKRRKEIRSRKARKTAGSAAATVRTGDRLQEALAYLTDWYEHPETWKFKKLLQVTLIKHAFDADLINDDAFELFLHYLAGMQGKSIDRLTALCHRLVENNGLLPDSFDPEVPCPTVEATPTSSDCLSSADPPTSNSSSLLLLLCHLSA